MSKEAETKKITLALLEMTSKLIDEIEYSPSRDAYFGNETITLEGYKITCVVEKLRR